MVGAFAMLSGMLAAPLKDETKIISYNFENLPDNAYQFSFVLSDTQTREESGYFKYIGETPVLVVKGSYSFIGDDGQKYVVNYIADELGYRVEDDVVVKEPVFRIQALPANIIASLAG